MIDFVCLNHKGAMKLTEEKKTTENDEFKVVMPEANREEMPETPFETQPAYLKVFADFYIARFNENDLEIMNLFDTAHHIVDINTYLLDNLDFSRKNLVKHVLQIHGSDFKTLLTEIAEKTEIDPEEMATYEDWAAWYTKQREEIMHALS